MILGAGLFVFLRERQKGKVIVPNRSWKPHAILHTSTDSLDSGKTRYRAFLAYAPRTVSIISLHVFGVRIRRDPMPEVEDMRTVLERINHLAGLVDQVLPARHHVTRRQGCPARNHPAVHARPPIRG